MLIAMRYNAQDTFYKEYVVNNEYFPCEDNKNTNLERIQETTKIMDRFLDTESKSVFEKRLLFSITKDVRYINELVSSLPIIKNVRNRFGNDNYIYGAGRRLRDVIDIFGDVSWSGIIDANKSLKYNDIDVKPVDQYDFSEESCVIISIKDGWEDVKEILISKGITENHIISFESILQEIYANMYFDKGLLDRLKNASGVFIDAGCFDGKDSLRAKAILANITKAYAFEPDTINFKQILRHIKDKKSFALYPIGLSDFTGEVGFENSGDGSHITAEGSLKIPVNTIDSILNGERVGFIKMDIEGSEEQAINGAIDTIRKWKPYMAISVYHKSTDIWRIPLTILDICDHYDFAFRHYSLCWADTVLYALPRSVMY